MAVKLGGQHDPAHTLYLDDARDYIIAYTGRESWPELPPSLAAIQVELAVQAWNRRGLEGLSSSGNDGVSFHVDTLPAYMERALNQWRVGRTLPIGG
jgi:hypothetical protein